MVYKTKTYIAFDGGNDMNYYNTLKMWSNNDKINFKLNNAHDLKSALDSSLPESIKRSLRERIQSSKIMILIVGKETHHHIKFVKYEVEYAKSLNMPIILAVIDGGILPKSWFFDYPVIQVPFKLENINLAMNDWPLKFQQHKKQRDVGIWQYK
ncbi:MULTISPECIES: TIR domain-containing protein [unclassified Enterococcus]|uniref:TIR domain-containing protein n=1 Tax=unclassified Enterococcus TaxID=2608891 RepID=UPI0015545014|nr:MULTISPECIES: TIR domain-containing protein [unclassified Enterococcus]MBS7577990.1 TIR domain-containing protein [Enterococcus sp. MMGLQ5-2]MBS7585149.1 TIR domain-containing protein [Enterococcus sp. MMGLQ5-1]NPD13005.1 molecular chaperone Tir [Enterococcus sp. MMGLQ5-1]NPD37821.1 molecular chaperone Tir [Enterococcus sp. MMGLQ5-2]